MALDTAHVQQLQDALAAVESWKVQKLQALESQAEFLRSIRTPLSSLSQTTQDVAVSDATAFLTSLSIPTS